MVGDTNDPRLNVLIDAVSFCRSLVIDAVEFEIGDHPCWVQLRSRLLRAFGDKGLSRRISEIMNKDFLRQANGPLQAEGDASWPLSGHKNSLSEGEHTG